MSGKKITVGILLSLILCVAITSRLTAGEGGLAIFLEGKVLIRLSGQEAFRPLQTMDDIPIDSRLRLDNGASVRILNPNGSMTRLAETGEVRYSAIDSTKNLRSFHSIMEELFKTTQKKYLPAVRTVHPEQQLWASLLKQETFSVEDVQPLLRLMSIYHASHHQNRLYVLSRHLRSVVRDDPRYAVLTSGLPKPEHKRQQWVMIRIGKQNKEIIDEDAVIHPGDNLQIGFHTGQEIYFYQFHTRHSLYGKTETSRLFPLNDEIVNRDEQPYFPSRVVPQQTLSLPAKNQAYRVRNQDGDVLFWAWSCLGPLSRSELDRATRMISGDGREDAKFFKSMLSDKTPDTCHLHYRKIKSGQSI